MFLLDATLRSSVLLVLALGGCLAWRRRSASWRHFVLAAGVGAALLVTPLRRAPTVDRGPFQPNGDGHDATGAGRRGVHHGHARVAEARESGA
jgi:hypothetical protein